MGTHVTACFLGDSERWSGVFLVFLKDLWIANEFVVGFCVGSKIGYLFVMV